MCKIVCIFALSAITIKAYSQFNTVKVLKVLPEIQVNTAKEKQKNEDSLLILEPVGFEANEKKAGILVSMPLSAPIINSTYGSRIDPLTGKVKFHYGIDFESASDSVMVILPGEVKKVAYSRGLGNYIEVEHGNFKTIYGHLSVVMVREEMKLEAGSIIGLIGSTGRSTGNHLHFAIKHKNNTIDPTPFLDLIYRTLELNAKKED